MNLCGFKAGLVLCSSLSKAILRQLTWTTRHRPGRMESRLGDGDRSWAPRVRSTTRYVQLIGWVKGKKRMPFAGPVIKRETFRHLELLAQ